MYASGRKSRRSASELRINPVHHRAQLAALTLDLRVLLLLAHALEVLLPGAILRDPLARELARLDLAEHILHRLPRRLGDDSLPARVVAVLGGVRDRVAHAADALLVHEVDDQLHLVEALEVGEARVIAGIDQRLVTGLHQLADAAAEHRLLAEEVSLRLLPEGGLDHTPAGAADALRVREHEGARVPACVLVD